MAFAKPLKKNKIKINIYSTSVKESCLLLTLIQKLKIFYYYFILAFVFYPSPLFLFFQKTHFITSSLFSNLGFSFFFFSLFLFHTVFCLLFHLKLLSWWCFCTINPWHLSKQRLNVWSLELLLVQNSIFMYFQDFIFFSSF